MAMVGKAVVVGGRSSEREVREATQRRSRGLGPSAPCW